MVSYNCCSYGITWDITFFMEYYVVCGIYIRLPWSKRQSIDVEKTWGNPFGKSSKQSLGFPHLC